MKRLGAILLGLAALAVLVLELDQFRKPAPVAAPEEPRQEQPAPEMLARRQAERDAWKAMVSRIDNAVAKLDADGIPRSDLIRYFMDEALDEADLDGVCRERSLDNSNPD